MAMHETGGNMQFWGTGAQLIGNARLLVLSGTKNPRQTWSRVTIVMDLLPAYTTLIFSCLRLRAPKLDSTIPGACERDPNQQDVNHAE